MITFADLAWTFPDAYTRGYPREWKRWGKRASRDTIYVLLQHDVDAAPERTLAVLELEAARGLRSNVMVFARRHDPWKLEHGELEYLDYDIGVPRLQELERAGFVVGYHSCAVEQSLWDLTEAQRRFRDDVRLLRASFDIRFFNPHGGVAGPNGENNNAVTLPLGLRRSLKWVSNRHGCRFSGAYSDGELYGKPLDDRDLRAFVRSWKPGKRYRVSTHPQYYGAAAPVEQLAGVPWYGDLFGRSPAEIWA